MGTSASGTGAGNKNPLIPSWIPSDGDQPPQNDENNNNNDNDQPDNGNENDAPDDPPRENPDVPPQENPNLPPRETPVAPAYRYTAPRKQLNRFVSSGGTDRSAFGRALKGYSKSAAGGTSKLARRMAPSIVRVSGFIRAVNSIRSEGLDNALRRFNLSEYIGKPIIDILAALTDIVFADGDSTFNNTQDDSLTKQAYSNTITRICEIDKIDLNTLTNDNIEVMTAIFIEETIVQRVFTDIGNDITKRESDIEKLVEIERTAYQIVSGFVRTQIMPEIKAVQLGDKTELNSRIQNIYRVAFDVLSNLQD